MNWKRVWMVPTLAGLLALAGCTSTEKRTTTSLETLDRTEYIKTVDRRLDDWEKEASNLSNEERGRDMMASVRDARAELRNLESAPSSEFDAYRRRVDSRLDHIENMEEVAE
jgi:hypothetical protein